MEKDVTRQIEEQLSAFLDGELPEQELALLVRRLERDESHRATLDRYALISSALRDEPTPDALRLRRGVMAALDGEQATPQPPVVHTRRRPVYGLAAAAALVALVTGLVVTQQGGAPQPGAGVMAELAATAQGDEPANAPDGAAAVTAARPQADAPLLAGAQPGTAAVGAGSQVAPVVVQSSVVAVSRERQRPDFQRLQQHSARMRSYLISHGEYSRPFQGAMADSRMYVQQAGFQE